MITGLEPRAHDALLRRRAGADPDPKVRERLLMLLAGARGTWLWHWPDLIIDGSAVTRPAATIEFDADLRSLLADRASDPSVLVRVATRLLVAAAQPVPPGAVLLGEFLSAPPSAHLELGIALMAAGGLDRDPAVVARLGELLGSEESDELRLFLAAGLFRVGHADAEPVLRTLLRAADRYIRRGALVVLARNLERSQGRLLTEDVDGISLFLDPLEPIMPTRLVQVAERTDKPLDEVRRDYERLASFFGLGDWVRG